MLFQDWDKEVSYEWWPDKPQLNFVSTTVWTKRGYGFEPVHYRVETKSYAQPFLWAMVIDVLVDPLPGSMLAYLYRPDPEDDYGLYVDDQEKIFFTWQHEEDEPWTERDRQWQPCAEVRKLLVEKFRALERTNHRTAH